MASCATASPGYPPRPATRATDATAAATPRSGRRERALEPRFVGLKKFRIVFSFSIRSVYCVRLSLLRRARKNPARTKSPPNPRAHRTLAPVDANGGREPPSVGVSPGGVFGVVSGGTGVVSGVGLSPGGGGVLGAVVVVVAVVDVVGGVSGGGTWLSGLVTMTFS